MYTTCINFNDRETEMDLMGLSKALDTINHELLIAKLHVYHFSNYLLLILLNYLSHRKQIVKKYRKNMRKIGCEAFSNI